MVGLYEEERFQLIEPEVSEERNITSGLDFYRRAKDHLKGISVERNCSGYVREIYGFNEEETSRLLAITRQYIKRHGLMVKFSEEEKPLNITCPRFLVDNSHVCLNASLRRGLREGMCSNNKQHLCATYDVQASVHHEKPGERARTYPTQIESDERMTKLAEQRRADLIREGYGDCLEDDLRQLLEYRLAQSINNGKNKSNGNGNKIKANPISASFVGGE